MIVLSDSEEQTSCAENESEDRTALIRKKAVKHKGSELEVKPEDRSSAPVTWEKVDPAISLQKPNSEPSPPKKTKSKRKRKQESDEHEECIVKQGKVLQTKSEHYKQQQESPQQTNKEINDETSHRKMDGPSSKKRRKGDMKEKSNVNSETTSNDPLKGCTAMDGKEVKNLPAAILKYKNEETNSDLLAEGPQLEEPKKKKKDYMNVSVSPGNGSEKPSKSGQTRSLPNGLVIEELKYGDQDGKAATLGRKIEGEWKCD